MFKMNSEMLKTYSNLSLTDIELEHDLREIAESGFTSKDGCVFLSRCLEVDTNVNVSNFADQTGYECFINSVNVDDYVDSRYLEQGICFVRNVFTCWNKTERPQKLVAILSMDEFSLKIKIHIKRSGESWLADEFEDYEESLMMVDSSESTFLENV